MAEATSFTMGAAATCTDGVCGKVARVVVDPVARTQLLPGVPGYPGYGPEQVLFMPYYGLGVGAAVPLTVTYDTIPLDEVEVRCQPLPSRTIRA